MNGDTGDSREITFRDVYHRLGGLENSIKSFSNSLDRLEGRQSSFEKKLENVAAVMNSKTLKEDDISDMVNDIDALQANQNQFIGGKAAVILIIVISVSVLSAVAGLWMSYKSDKMIEELQRKVIEFESGERSGGNQ